VNPDRLQFRHGRADDAPAILALIDANLDIGHLLPRTLADLVRHASRFLVVVDDERLVGCAELAPLSRAVAEVRSLVVESDWRGHGLGTALVARLEAEARRQGFSTVCAFTHDPSHFVRLGFSIVPHVWFPEKIATDCTSCPKFRVCGQVGVALPIDNASLSAPMANPRRVPIAAPHTRPSAAPGPTVRYLKAVNA
jgi:amino-acid N-acetyltransferase